MRDLMIVLTVLLSLSACDKESDFENNLVTGKVVLIEEQDGEVLGFTPDYELLGSPIENVPITIWNDQSEYELEDCCWFPADWRFKEIVMTDATGRFSFTIPADAYLSDYKATVESNDFHYIPTSFTDENLGLAVYKNCKLPITIIDTMLETENTFCITTDIYKTDYEIDCVSEYELSEDGTKRIYKMEIDIYANYNSSLTLKMNNEDHSVIEHFTGTQSDPQPLVISI